MKKFLKDVLFLVLNFNSNLSNRASILMYHSVGINKAFFTVSPAHFEKQIAYLKKNRRVVKLSDFIHTLNMAGDISNCVCITFDDGYFDNYENTFPVLKKYGVPATIFVPTNYIGGSLTNSENITLPLLNSVQIKEMQETGLAEFMPHSESHRVFKDLSAEEIKKETNGSRKSLETVTGREAAIFAFPKGVYTQHAVTFLKENLWLGAVTTKEGTVSTNSDTFTLKRNSIDSSTTFVQFRGKIGRAIDRYVALKQLLKRPSSHGSKN